MELINRTLPICRENTCQVHDDEEESVDFLFKKSSDNYPFNRWIDDENSSETLSEN